MKSFKRTMACILCLLLVVSVVGCTSDSANKSNQAANKVKKITSGEKASDNVINFKAGKYTATAKGHNGEIKVETEFSEHAIVAVKVLKNSETGGVGEAAIDKMPGLIVESQSLAVDAVSGATMASNAILEAVTDCVKQAGADPKQLAVKSTNTGKEIKTVNLTTDVVVVGAGASGTAAALAAVDAGSKVILLEKTSIPAGAGTMAGGLFATGSKLQKEAKVPDASQWLYHEYMTASNNTANARLVRNVIEKSGSTVDWLMENGARFKLIDPGVGGQPDHVNDPHAFLGYADGGFKAITALHDSIKKKGGEIYFDTAGKSLITNEKGEVIGINAEKKDGSKYVIKAKSVILATGGYAANAEMMAEHFGKKAPLGSISSATGDGLKMAWDSGAAHYGEDVGQFFYLNGAKESVGMKTAGDIWTIGSLPLLWVNKNGERFTNEEVVFEYAAMGNAIYEQPDAMTWIVFDQDTVNTIKQKGTIGIVDVYSRWKNKPQSFMEFNEPVDTVALNKQQETPYDLAPFLKEGEQTGVVVSASTLAELGEKAGMDKQSFEATAKRYADMAGQNKDTDFFKDSKYLSKLNQGPFYAVKVVTRTLTTLGGVKVNQHTQAVDDNEKVIPGLWAVGSDAGGMYGNSYVMFEGGTLGFAYNSGRIAGESAAAYATLNKN